MEPRWSQVVNGYGALAQDLAARWTDRAAAVAASVDAGAYDADRAAADLAATALLAAQSTAMVVMEALDALAILTSAGDDRRPTQPDTFETTLPGAALAVDDAFVNGFGAPLQPAAITVEPAQLDPQATAFRVSADGTGCAGGTYMGTVRATAPGGNRSELVDAWVTVP